MGKGEGRSGVERRNWLRDREFLTENRSTFIFCLFDTFATFLLTVSKGAGGGLGRGRGKVAALSTWQAVAPYQILILKNRITSLKFVNNVLENLLAQLPAAPLCTRLPPMPL